MKAYSPQKSQWQNKQARKNIHKENLKSFNKKDAYIYSFCLYPLLHLWGAEGRRFLGCKAQGGRDEWEVRNSRRQLCPRWSSLPLRWHFCSHQQLGILLNCRSFLHQGRAQSIALKARSSCSHKVRKGKGRSHTAHALFIQAPYGEAEKKKTHLLPNTLRSCRLGVPFHQCPCNSSARCHPPGKTSKCQVRGSRCSNLPNTSREIANLSLHQT